MLGVFRITGHAPDLNPQCREDVSHLPADLSKPDDHHAPSRELPGGVALPQVCRLPLGQQWQFLDEVEHSRQREFGQRDRMHTCRGRENDVGAVESGLFEELADPGTCRLHPPEIRAVACHVGRGQPVEVEADVGGGQQ
jgi:hypothetical protein